MVTLLKGLQEAEQKSEILISHHKSQSDVHIYESASIPSPAA